MNKKKDIVISVQFKGAIEQIDLLEHLLSEFNSWEFSKIELHYVIREYSAKTFRGKTFGGVVNKKTINNFKRKLSLCDGKTVSIDGFTLCSNLPNWKYRAIDLEFSSDLTLNKDCDINSLNFTFDIEYNGFNIRSFFDKIIMSFFLSHKCEIQNSFIFACEKYKMPIALLHGIHTEFLNKYEDKKVSIWSDNKNTCDKKVLDVFWGNIISKEHLKKISVEDIERLVGKSNVFSLTPDLLWFNLPEDLLKFEFSKYSWKRKRIYRFFEKKQLIMS